MRQLIEFFEDMPIIGIIVTLMVLVFLFVLVDGAASIPTSLSGEVVGKHYEPMRTSIGNGNGLGNEGGVVTTTTTEITPEKFLIMVKTENDEIITVKCSPELYYREKVGDTIDLYVYEGFFTGINYGAYGVQ
jgi:hypothetical protein